MPHLVGNTLRGGAAALALLGAGALIGSTDAAAFALGGMNGQGRFAMDRPIPGLGRMPEGPHGARMDHGGGMGPGMGMGMGIGLGVGIIGSAVIHAGESQPSIGQKTDPDNPKGGFKRGRKDDSRHAARAGGGQEKPDNKKQADARQDNKKPDNKPGDDKPGANKPPETQSGDKTPATKTADADPGPKKRHLSIIHVDDPGKEEGDPFAIDCSGHTGKISVHTGVEITWKPIDPRASGHQTDMISIGYKGTNCDDCMWVQTLWSEARAYKDAKKKDFERVKTKMNTKAGLMDLTTDPDHPNYIIDSGSRLNPAYESAGTSNVDAESNVIFDRTSAPWDLTFYDEDNNPYGMVKTQQDNTVEKIEYIDHFATYLVCKGQVCAKVSWTATYTYTHEKWKPADDIPVYSGISISATDKPTSGEYEALFRFVRNGLGGGF
jgi:hypothetical protein